MLRAQFLASFLGVFAFIAETLKLGVDVTFDPISMQRVKHNAPRCYFHLLPGLRMKTIKTHDFAVIFSLTVEYFRLPPTCSRPKMKRRTEWLAESLHATDSVAIHDSTRSQEGQSSAYAIFAGAAITLPTFSDRLNAAWTLAPGFREKRLSCLASPSLAQILPVLPSLAQPFEKPCPSMPSTAWECNLY